MVFKSEEGRDALIHVLANVFEVQDDHPLTLSLQEHGLHDIQAIINASSADVYALAYKNCQGNLVDLQMIHKQMIILFKSYHQWRCWTLGDLIGNDWKLMTAYDFDYHRYERIGTNRKWMTTKELGDYGLGEEFELRSLCQVPSTECTTQVEPKEATNAHEMASDVSVAHVTLPKSPIVVEPLSKAPIMTKTLSKAPDVLKTTPKATIVLETLSKASTVLDIPIKIRQEALCPHTQVVTPICLFPEVPSTATSVHDSVHDGNCGLGSDIIPTLLVDEESDDDNGKNVLVDVTISLDTFHDAQMFPSHAYPIPLVTLQGHYNTVHLLPPANGPPTLPGLAFTSL